MAFKTDKIGINKELSSQFQIDVSGNINIDGSIFQNGIEFSGGTGTNYWNKTGNNIYYNDGSVGVGVIPESIFHVRTGVGNDFKIKGDTLSLIFNNVIGGNDHVPYIEWRNSIGTRLMYMGWGDGSTYVQTTLQNGANYSITGGNVGFGTTTPITAMHLHNANPTFRLSNTTINSANSGTIEFAEELDSATQPTVKLGYNGSSNDFFIQIGSPASSNALTIARDTGNVSITQNLSVTGTISASGYNDSNWNTAYTHVSSNGTDHSYINQSVTSTSTPTFDNLRIGENPRELTSTGIELQGSTSSALLGVQDGNGRIQLKWNATNGIAENYLTSSEPAFFWDITVTTDPIWEMKYDGGGTAGNAISWSTLLSLTSSGELSATSFSGSGASLTSLNANNISSGTINDARLPATISSDITGNAATATKLANINTSFSGTYPMTVNVSGTIYSNANVTYNGTSNTLTSPNFAGALSGNATTASWADQVDVNTSASSSSFYNILWHSGDTVYGSNGKFQIKPSDGTLEFAEGVWHQSTAGTPRLYFGTNSHTYIRTADDIRFRNSTGSDVGLYDAGNTCWGFGGGTSSSYSVYVTGAVYATGDITGNSDIRFKENIKPFTKVLDKLDNINPIIFNYKEDPGNLEYGYSAQEMNEVFPHAVTYDKDNDRYSLRLMNLSAINTTAIKELKEENKNLKNKVNSLEEKLKNIEEKLNKLI